MRLQRWFAIVTVIVIGALLFGVSGTLAGCGAAGGGHGTPQETLQALQVALRDDLPIRAFAAQDAETRAYFRQRVRTARARVAEGATAESAGPDDDVARPLYHEGTLDEAAARASVELGQLDAMREWLTDCLVVGGAVVDGGDVVTDATLRVRATDGSKRDVYFLREHDGWKLDAFRHFQESMSNR